MTIKDGFLVGGIIAVFGALAMTVATIKPKREPAPYSAEPENVSGPVIVHPLPEGENESPAGDSQFFPTTGSHVPDTTPFFQRYNFAPYGSEQSSKVTAFSKPRCKKQKYGPEPSVYFRHNNTIVAVN